MSPATAFGRSTARLFLVIVAAAAMVLSFALTATPALGGQVGDQGTIAVFKTMCESFGQQDTCNGRDDSLEGYHIDYSVVNTETQDETVITVTLGENAGGGGNTGGGSQGRIESDPLPVGEYRVCEAPEEAPIAYKEGEDDVPLDALPRPESGNGGSTGGSQTQDGNCIVVTITTGTSELKFLNQRLDTPAEPTLVIDKEADATTITITGSTASPSIVTWTLTYTLTDGPVTGAVITDEVPAGFTFLDASDGGTFAAGTVTWTLPSPLTSSGSVSFRTTVDVATISRTAPTTNVAVIDSDQTEADEGEDSVTVTVGGQAGGNPTPSPDVPDTAMGETFEQVVQLPATWASVAFLGAVALLLGVRLARRR